MSEITMDMVKELRQRTQAGVKDCRDALVATEGDIDKAVALLREKGLAQAAKKSGRVAADGLVDAYIHGEGRIGVLIEVNCETDFVAKTEEFQRLVRDLAMQVAAARPEYVRREDVPEHVVQAEREIYENQARNEGKPEQIIERIVNGRLDKFFEEVCLLEQPFIKDPDKTVERLIQEKVASTGENITVRRFVRFEKGEGIEKKEDDFAAEVRAQIQG